MPVLNFFWGRHHFFVVFLCNYINSLYFCNVQKQKQLEDTKMNTTDITKGIEKVNEIIREIKALKAQADVYADDYYNGTHNPFSLEKACDIFNVIGRKEGGIYRRMKNLIRAYYDDNCQWLDSMATNYGKDEDIKCHRMWREFSETFRHWGVAIEIY